MIDKETGIQFHYPGSNFTGPGTHVAYNILNNILPTSKTDYVARQHDIDYLKSSGDPFQAMIDDAKAIARSDFSLEGLAMKTGLFSRMAGSLYTGFNSFNFNQNNDTHEFNRQKGAILQSIIDSET